MPSVKPDSYVPTSRQPSVKPTDWRTTDTIYSPAPEPAEVVPDPLALKPNEQPNPRDAALRYVFEQNERLRKRREKANR